MANPSLLLGRVLGGRYHLTELIGAGGMASVFRATVDGSPTPVAVKVLHPSLAADPSFVKRFRLEARTAASVAHDNAVIVLDHGVDHGLPFMVMELLRGRDLASLIAAEGRLPPWRALDLTAQICDVLSLAHRLGILHRDLKPENVVILGSPPGEHVKVLDFGLAKIYAPKPGAEVTAGITRHGVALGTPAYMSPEQCGAEKLDQRSDVYACGVLLFQMLTGRVPFEGRTEYETMVQHLTHPPPSLRELDASIPEAVERAVLKALAKKPAQRFQTARHFQETLLRIAWEL